MSVGSAMGRGQGGLKSQPSITMENALQDIPGSLGNGKPFGSMCLEDLVKELWQEGGFAGPTTPSTRAAEQLSCPPLRENVPEELRAKTLDEAWTLAHSAPGQPTQTQTQLQGGMKIGDYITKVLNRGNLSMQGQNPENSRQVLPSNLSNSGTRNVRAMQRAAKDRRKRNGALEAGSSLDGTEDNDVVKRQKRMVKNRESAARSRQRKQQYTEELEKQVAALKQENEALKKTVAELKSRSTKK